MKKSQTRVAAVIEIGSSAARMCVSQWSNDSLTTLDRLEMPIRIGQEVFTGGRVGFEAMRELSTLLDGFSATAREYGVEHPRAIATTALREAANRAHVLDHLRIRNHMDVEVLEENETNAIIYHDMLRQMGKTNGRVLFVNAGSGATGLALWEDGLFIHSRSLHTGTIKIAEMLRQVSALTEHTDRAALEYINAFLSATHAAGELSGASAVAISSRGAHFLFALCGGKEEKGVPIIEAKNLVNAWDQFCGYGPEQFASKIGLTQEEGELIFAELVIYAEIQRLTGVERFYVPRAEILDAILSLQLRPKAKRVYEEMGHASLLASARETARHYRCDLNHANAVAAGASMLFGKLRKVHGLSRRQSALLEAACILHECRHFTGSSDTFYSSGAFSSIGALLRESGLYFVHENDGVLIGRIISAAGARAEHPQEILPEEGAIFVAKMHALLRLSDALDASRKQKAAITDVELKRNRMILRVSVREDYALEQWAFSQVAPIVEEVFGLEPKLEILRDQA